MADLSGDDQPEEIFDPSQDQSVLVLGQSRRHKSRCRDFPAGLNYRYIGDVYATGYGYQSRGVEISPCDHHGDHDIEYCLAATAHKLPGYVDHQVLYHYDDHEPDRLDTVEFLVLCWNPHLTEVGYLVLAQTYLAYYKGWGNVPALPVSAKICILNISNRSYPYNGNKFYPSSDLSINQTNLRHFYHHEGVEAAVSTLAEMVELAHRAEDETESMTQQKMSSQAYGLM